MKIVVKFMNTGVLSSLKFQLFSGEIVRVAFKTRIDGNGVFTGCDATLRADQLHYIKKVIEAEVCNNVGTQDADLESIAFYGGVNDDELLSYLPNIAMERFQKITVDMDGFQETMSMEKYNKIAKFVRQKDRLDNLKNAMDCSLNELYYQNIKDCLDGEVKNSPDMIASEWSEIEDYSGEDELQTLDKILTNRGGMAWYELISNKGTECECHNMVLLMCSKAETWQENIRERDNGVEMLLSEGDIVLKDENGDSVDLFFVDEIIYQEREYLY